MIWLIHIYSHVDFEHFLFLICDVTSSVVPGDLSHAQSCSPVERQVEEVDVVLQAWRQLGQASGGAVHRAVPPAAGAHGGADGHHPTPDQPTQQQEEAGGHGPGSAGRRTALNRSSADR